MGNHFIEGILHITDFEGYDHMLFLLALCAPYTVKQWKPIVLLATGFTLGHSISLALAAFDVLRFSSYVIELLIPATIVATALSNLYLLRQGIRNVPISTYIITALFGIIHGFGFSSFFRMIYDETSSRVMSLLLFNLGVETGQLLIIAAILLLSLIAVRWFKIPAITYARALSIIAAIIGTWIFWGNL